MNLDDIVSRCQKAIEDLRAVSEIEGAEPQADLARTIYTLYAAIHALPLGPAPPAVAELRRDKLDA